MLSLLAYETSDIAGLVDPAVALNLKCILTDVMILVKNYFRNYFKKLVEPVGVEPTLFLLAGEMPSQLGDGPIKPLV